MSTVPWTVVLLEEDWKGPDFFKETAVVAEFGISKAVALKQALEKYEQESPRVRVVGILRGAFASTWVGAHETRTA